MDDEPQETMIAGYRALADFFTKKGFKTSHSTMTKYCSPAINIGPPCEGYWAVCPSSSPAAHWSGHAIACAKSSTPIPLPKCKTRSGCDPGGFLYFMGGVLAALRHGLHAASSSIPEPSATNLG
jgi:hypothetical protein